MYKRQAQALDRLLERPQEIRLNIYDENKKNAQILEKEQNNFMGVMGKIFQQSGITRPSNEEWDQDCCWKKLSVMKKIRLEEKPGKIGN